MSCIYCQNYEISQLGRGKDITIVELANIFLELQEKMDLNYQIIYNTNSYENVETIKALNGYIDIYLPDLKYYSNELSKKYSKVDKYFEVATKAIKEMYCCIK